MGFLEHQIEQMVNHIDHQQQLFHQLLKSSPPGSLHHRKDRVRSQFVHAVPDSEGNTTRRIISEDDLLHALAQKEYAQSALKIIGKQQALIHQMSDKITDITPSKLIPQLRPAYRSLPMEMFLPDAYSGELAEDDPSLPGQRHSIPPERLRQLQQWAAQPYEMSDYKPEERDKETSRGLMVRSKSEALICEKCDEFFLPFRYEEVIQIGNYKLAPDLTFLCRDNQKLFLEYCGMMDNPKYVEQYLWKRKLYEGAGIYQWTNMIYIFEQSNRISVRQIKNVLLNQVLPRL